MRAVGQRVAGELQKQGDRTALILNALKPGKEAENLIMLRFAFIIRGPGDGAHIFPALILDDWGREIRSLQLYSWVRENGERFPRAEIFGFEQDGRETQCFLREIELYAHYPCYAFDQQEHSVAEGHLVEAILLPDESIKSPEKGSKPKEVQGPLRSARVTWWRVPSSDAVIDLSQLDLRADPGY